MSARPRTFRERLYGADAVRTGSAPELPPLVAGADDGAPAPLSFAQQRIWFYDQLYPGDPLYHGAGAFRLRGPLDVGALRGALDALVARQPSLRAHFPASRGVPAHVTVEGVPFALHETSAPDEAAALAAVVAEVRRPFDLARDRSLTRAILVSLSPADHMFSIALHHAVWDGTSMGLVYEDLRAAGFLRRLRALAANGRHPGGAGAAARILARAAGRRSRARAAHGPRLRGGAGARERADRFSGRLSGRGRGRPRARAHRRLFHQHARAARRPGRRA